MFKNANDGAEQYQPETAEDMQDALRDFFGPMFEAMLTFNKAKCEDCMEKLFDAMYGKRFSVVFIADCKGINEIKSLCMSYEDIYSKLSPFAQSQQTIGKTDGVTDTESFIEGVTNTTNSYCATTDISAHQLC